MLKQFRKSGLSAIDLIAAAAALILVLILIRVALYLAWFPANLRSYILVAVVAAVAWPVSRVVPTATLVVIAVVVAAPPLWGVYDMEIRVIPLAVAAFRAAAIGARAWVVISVTTVAALCALLPDAEMIFSLNGPVDNRFIVDAIHDPSQRLMIALILVVILALGFAINRMRLVSSALAARNHQLVVLQEAEQERVVTEMRTAIARDIHDVVAHHVAAMVVRAQAADSVSDREPERLREAVQAIVSEGNTALTAMRRAVRVMRSDSRNPLDEPVSFHSAVEALTGRLRDVGKHVAVEGDLSSAAPESRQTVLWILQEALTNVMLHSDTFHVRVQFTTTASSVGLIVDDDGPSYMATALSLGGNGIIGMRERTASQGGSLSAGPRADGGWSVRAEIPTPRTSGAV